MQVWNALHAARCKCRTQKSRQKSPSRHHRTTLSGYTFATKARIDNRKKNLLSSNISSICPHNMVNFGLLAAEIVSGVWGTPATFNGFRVLAALLHGSQVVGVSQTLRRWTEALAHILVTIVLMKKRRTECILFKNIATSCVADICQPAGYRLTATAAKCKHDITWMSSANRNRCNT